MSLSVGTQLGSFEITGQIGAGGMGEVYRATDTKLGRDVAIKTLPASLAEDKDRLARFEREAKLLASLNHAHIASVYNLDEHDGTLYIAMELVEGETLEETLKRGALPVDDALQLGLQIALALEAAHDKGVVHRDLKPANIMITPDGEVKVLDFGLAKAFSGDPDEASPGHSPALSVAMTQQGLILGTAGYMSPEQASGQATDQRADIWSYGVVLYEMLSGMPVFSGESVPHILAAVLQLEPDWERLPRDLHPRLKLMLERCLEKKPRNRYHSIADARVDIEAALNDPEGVTPASVGRETGRPASRRVHPAGAAGIAVAAAALATLIAWLTWPSAPPRPITRFPHLVTDDQSIANVAVQALALSSDGRRFVYSTIDGLILRNMDQLTTRRIPGSEENMVHPFFSPDGQSVGYFVPGPEGIERIAIDGGASVPISEFFGIPLGANWEEDGMIYFGQPGGIYRVPGTGGVPDLIIPAEEGEVYYGPSLLPDGDSLLFSVSAGPGDWDTGGIVVESLSTGVRKTLLTGGNDPRYVPTGHIVYAFEDDLFGIAFDLELLSVSGGAVSLVQGVMRAGASASANYDIAADGTLVYVAGDAVRGTWTLVWVDRDGTEEPIAIEPSSYIYPRISPDGERVALDDRNSEDDLWIWDFEAKTRTRLGVGEQGGAYPVWTSDDARIAYSVAEGGIWWRASNSTGATERLLAADRIPDSGVPSPYFFAPSDNALVFRDQAHPDTLDNIGMVVIEGDGEPVWLLSESYNERNAELSPDGNWMAYQSDETGQWEIYVAPFPNVDDDRVLVSNNGGIYPLWSRNGSELFYIEEDTARLMAVTVESTDSDFAYSERTAVLEWPYTGGQRQPEGRPYDVSPDGQRFLTVVEASTDNRETTEIIVIQNWTEELKRLVPTEQ